MSVLLIINLLLALGFFCASLTYRHLGFTLGFKNTLRFSYLILGIALFLPLLTSFLPRQSVDFPQIRKVVSESRPHSFSLKKENNPSPPASFMGTNYFPSPLYSLWVFFSLFLLGRFTVRLFQTKQQIKNAHLIRSLGRVQILACPSSQIAWSFATPFTRYVVLPEECLLLPHHRDVIAHEIQHHRTGDTLALYFFEALKIIFFFNPFTWFWSSLAEELQELACDESLVGRKRVSTQAYGRCLFEAAKTAVRSRGTPVGTAAFASKSAAFLSRRIKMLSHYNEKKRMKVPAALIAGSLVLGFASIAFGSRSLATSGEITLAEAQVLVENQKPGEFPIDLNPRVLKWLNYFLADPKGIEYVDQALMRLPTYRRLIETKIDEYGLPRELLAVAFIESGFVNAPPIQNPYRAAGVWQFMASTARNYGLRVDDQSDERMNVELETDAAMRYLGSNFLLLSDWRLATLGYNVGENLVLDTIDRIKSRDPWIVREAIETRESYLEKLVAAIIVLKHRGIL